MNHATDRALLGYAVLEGVTLRAHRRPRRTARGRHRSEGVVAARRRRPQRLLGTTARRCARHRHPQARRRRNRRGARRGPPRLAGRRRRSGHGADQAADRKGVHAEPRAGMPNCARGWKLIARCTATCGRCSTPRGSRWPDRQSAAGYRAGISRRETGCYHRRTSSEPSPCPSPQKN